MPTKCIGSRAFRVKDKFAVFQFDRPGLGAVTCVISSHRREVYGQARCKIDEISRTSKPVPAPDE